MGKSNHVVLHHDFPIYFCKTVTRQEILYQNLTLCHTTKILEWSKFKAFVEDKRNMTEKLKFVNG